MALKQNLSEKLKVLRHMKNTSLEDYSSELGISRSTLQYMESGNANSTLDTVEQIAKSLDIDAQVLLSSDITGSQLQTAMLLLQTLNSFRELPPEKRLAAAELFRELVMLLSGDERD